MWAGKRAGVRTTLEPIRGAETAPMPLTDLQRAVLETTATRDRAEAMLETLLRAKDEIDRSRKAENRKDLMAEVCGASSLDNAIASTKRMIDTLNRSLRKAEDDLHAAGQELDESFVHAHAGGRDDSRLNGARRR